VEGRKGDEQLGKNVVAPLVGGAVECFVCIEERGCLCFSINENVLSQLEYAHKPHSELENSEYRRLFLFFGTYLAFCSGRGRNYAYYFKIYFICNVLNHECVGFRLLMAAD
jgi:hypothetical protein